MIDERVVFPATIFFSFTNVPRILLVFCATLLNTYTKTVSHADDGLSFLWSGDIHDYFNDLSGADAKTGYLHNKWILKSNTVNHMNNCFVWKCRTYVSRKIYWPVCPAVLEPIEVTRVSKVASMALCPCQWITRVLVIPVLPGYSHSHHGLGTYLLYRESHYPALLCSVHALS